MSPEAEKILDVYRERNLHAGQLINLADFGDALIQPNGSAGDKPIRLALAELFGGGYLIEHLAALELTDKGEHHAYRRVGSPLALDLEKLCGLLQDEQSENDLRRYFGVGLTEGQLPPFTGGRFELLAGGGDCPDVRDKFTPSDLLAVEMLSVRVPGPVALDLLEGPLGKQAAEHLRAIPADVPLWSDDAERLIAKDGHADRLWNLLVGQDGVGWVTAGKLLARKRPMLVPVYDEIVRCAMNGPNSFWTTLRDALRHHNGRLLNDIRALKKTSEIPADVTELRTLDVAVWMRHRRTHTQRGCVGF